MKRCSTSLIVREMQIKTTRRYPLTLVRKAIIKKLANNKFWRGCEKREPSYTIGGNVNWCSHYGEQYRGSLKKKLKIELPYDPAILLLSIYPEKSVIWKYPCTPVFMADFLLWLSGKESTCQCRRLGFNPWVRKVPWRRKWQPTPVFLPGKSHGQSGGLQSTGS